uniref:Bcl-2 homology protein n=1 Tax=Suberites domuncula TaxID=55567 RepID=Q5TJD7_SUBDO|nr:Bcl-2 homology protein [Suberites domuncula]
MTTESPSLHGSSGGNNNRERVDNNYGLPDDMTIDNEHIEELARSYIVNLLRREGLNHIADQFAPVGSTRANGYQLIERIVCQLEDERSQQFIDILRGLEIDQQNLRITYQTIVGEIFNDGVHWGRIVAFLVFSGHLAVHCARSNGLENRVRDVVEWTEAEMRLRVHQWVEDRGGWEAFIQHFDRNTLWNFDLSTIAVSAAMIAALFAAGLFTVKRFLS